MTTIFRSLTVLAALSLLSVSAFAQKPVAKPTHKTSAKHSMSKHHRKHHTTKHTTAKHTTAKAAAKK